MPENDETPDWQVEYKKLQRKLNRANKRNEDLTLRASETESSSRRTEQMVERMLDSDADTEFKQQMVTQREKDTATAQLEAELDSLLGEKELDFDGDPRLGEARRLIKEFNRTGDTSVITDVKAIINNLEGEPSDAGPDTVDDRIQSAVLADRQEHGRVDTGRTSAPVSNKVRYSDITNMSPRDGSASMKETMNKALDQFFEGR